MKSYIFSLICDHIIQFKYNFPLLRFGPRERVVTMTACGSRSLVTRLLAGIPDFCSVLLILPPFFARTVS